MDDEMTERDTESASGAFVDVGRSVVAVAHANRAIAVLAGAFALALSLAGGGRPSAWYDESATLAAVDRSPAQLTDLLGHFDAVHGAYYLVAMAWTHATSSTIFSLRALSALGLATAAGLVVLLMATFVSHPWPLVAGLVTAMTPGLAWSGLEARGYSWAAAVAVGMSYLLVVCRDRAEKRLWAAYAALATLGMWLSLPLALLVLAHGVALLTADRTLLRRWAAAAGVSMLLTVPLFVIAVRQREQVAWIDIAPRELAARVVVNQTFAGIRGEDAEPGLLLVAAVGLAVLGLSVGLLGLKRSLEAGRQQAFLAQLCLAWLLFPTLVLVAVTLIGPQIYQERYLILTVPTVSIAVTLGMMSLPGPARTSVGLLLVALAIPVLAHHRTAAPKYDDYRSLAAVAQGAEPSAVVFSSAAARGISMAYPAAFVGVEDLSLGPTGADSGTLFGRSSPPGTIGRVDVARRLVILYSPTGTPLRADAFGRRLLGLGCMPVERTTDLRYTATLLRC
jgi:mannosyltransferase